MDTGWHWRGRWSLLLLSVALPSLACGQSWSNSTGATLKWENGSNWLGGVPSSNQPATFVTNAVSAPVGLRFRTVSIDGTTSGSFPATMTINYLTVSAPGSGFAASHNAVFLENAGLATSLRILNTLTITSGGAVNLTNSALRLDGQTSAFFPDDGIVTLYSGSIVTTNVSTAIGYNGNGSFTVYDGTWLGADVVLGYNSGSTGILTVAGGTVTLAAPASALLQIGTAGQSSGTVVLGGGQLTVTNSETDLGLFGAGQMTVTGGTWRARYVRVGSYNGSQGSLTIAGGTSLISQSMDIGANAIAASGTVWMTGGQLTITNGTAGFLTVGSNGVGQITMSNGVCQSRILVVGGQAGSQGTLTIAGGTNIVTANSIIGNNANATGALWMTDGLLVATNGQTSVGGGGNGQMTVSNGMWQARGLNVGVATGSVGVLTLNGGANGLFGPLVVGGGGTGTINVAGGKLVVTNTPSSLPFGNNTLIVDGSVVINKGGTIIATNDLSFIGNFGSGSLTVNGGMFAASSPYLGTEIGSQGTLTLSAGTITVSSFLTVAEAVDSTGTVWITGGQYTGFAIDLGEIGVGRMDVSNGVFSVSQLKVGTYNRGTFTCAGGTNNIGYLGIGDQSPSTGQVWVTGGLLQSSNQCFIGTFGVGRMDVSNGTVRTHTVFVGSQSAHGTLTAAGGVFACDSRFLVGDCAFGSAGDVLIDGATMLVTNFLGTASVEVQKGTFTLSSGGAVINNFVMTNACGGQFVRTGGVLIYDHAILNLNDDTDGDGLPNGWEQAHGLDPLDPSGVNGANGDPDGDGFTNLEEYQGGSDPMDPNSIPFRITSIIRQGNNILVTWLTAGGKTNIVQATNGSNGNFVTNGFANLSAQMFITGSNLTTTNYLDVGGATNKPARYYRVRQVP